MVESIISLLFPLPDARTTIDLFCSFEENQTCFVVVGELYGCIEDRQESNCNEMRRLQFFVQVTILSHWLRRRETHKMEIHWQEWGQGVKEYTYEFRKQAIRMGLSLEELVMVVK